MRVGISFRRLGAVIGSAALLGTGAFVAGNMGGRSERAPVRFTDGQLGRS